MASPPQKLAAVKRILVSRRSSFVGSMRLEVSDEIQGSSFMASCKRKADYLAVDRRFHSTAHKGSRRRGEPA